MNLVSGARSFRKFKNHEPISIEFLRQLIDLARLTPSSRNIQPLRYVLISSKKAAANVFSCLNWAKALSSWAGPAESERPPAYIIILGDSNLSGTPSSNVGAAFSADPGIAAQTMKLGAWSAGIGCCMLASIDREKLRELFNIDDQLEILLVIALGIPTEKVVLELLPQNGKTAYWQDENNTHHVPKRSLDDLIAGEY